MTLEEFQQLLLQKKQEIEQAKGLIGWKYKAFQPDYAPTCGSEQRIHHLYVVVRGENDVRKYEI